MNTMKHIWVLHALILGLVLTSLAWSQPVPSPTDELPALPTGQAWKLVWHDEFAGTVLDASKWNIPVNMRRGHLWRSESARLDGAGHLDILTEKTADNYATACVRTRGHFEKAFGYFIARCKLPTQVGHWPAFWLFNDCVGKVGNAGRDGTEIDIIELPWRDGRVQQTLHWDGYGQAHQSSAYVSRPPQILDRKFHTFSLWWTPEEYVFYVDGRESWRSRAGGVCQVPLYLKLSEEIPEGLVGWAGDITKAKLPDHFIVDYVRVYDVVKSSH